MYITPRYPLVCVYVSADAASEHSNPRSKVPALQRYEKPHIHVHCFQVVIHLSILEFSSLLEALSWVPPSLVLRCWHLPCSHQRLLPITMSQRFSRARAYNSLGRATPSTGMVPAALSIFRKNFNRTTTIQCHQSFYDRAHPSHDQAKHPTMSQRTCAVGIFNLRSMYVHTSIHIQQLHYIDLDGSFEMR